MPNIQLLIIDAQNDFCDIAPTGTCPALPIPGADLDCRRLAELVRRTGAAIDGITATLDSHHACDVAHHICWQAANGRPPPPLTAVTAADLQSGRYKPAPGLAGRDTETYLLSYLQRLEGMGRRFILWPPHCLIGSFGHNLHTDVAAALQNWEIRFFRQVTFVGKGENIWTESFSALKAVVPYPGDISTELNLALLATLDGADRIWVAGQAGSHCVRDTVTDILRYASPGIEEKLVVLQDCMSPVPGFEQESDDFFAELRRQGVRLSNSRQIIADWDVGKFEA